jgi:hypothetical protein
MTSFRQPGNIFRRASFSMVGLTRIWSDKPSSGVSASAANQIPMARFGPLQSIHDLWLGQPAVCRPRALTRRFVVIRRRGTKARLSTHGGVWQECRKPARPASDFAFWARLMISMAGLGRTNFAVGLPAPRNRPPPNAGWHRQPLAKPRFGPSRGSTQHGSLPREMSVPQPQPSRL